MKIYAKNHPGCSLQEYCEYLDGEEKEGCQKGRR